MKNKGKFISLIIGTMALSSCGFDIIFSAIKEIKIEDYHNAYQVDQIFKDKNELNIKAIYTSGKVESLNYSDVGVSLSLNGKSVDASKSFGKEGTYSLSVTYNKKTSNSISFTVSKDFIYASNISLSLSSESVDINNFVTGSFTLSPSNYNVDVEFNHDKNISLKRTGKYTFEVEGVNGGEANLFVSASSGPSSYVTASKTITVNEVSKVSLTQTYSDYAKKCWYTVSACPSVGDVKLLVIPIWFTDSSSFFDASNRNNVRDDIRTAYFGSPKEAGWHSVSSFYQNESEGRLVLNGTVSDWYETGTSVNNYATDDNHGTKTGGLVESAANWYFSSHPEDSRTNYDYDGDGFLDGVIGIYAAPDKQSLSPKDPSIYSNLWAYCSNTNATADKVSPVTKAYFWASYDFMYGSNRALERTGASYSHGDTSTKCVVDTHTYIHEMGHVLGLEDYYDTTYQYNPAGGFSMQDANVGGHDPFSTMSLGWTDPYIPTRSVRMKIYSFQESGDVVLLTPKFNSANSPFDEYLALELFTPTGLNELDVKYRYSGNYPQGPNASGIRLWHVDARLTYRSTKTGWSTNLFSDISSVASNERILTAFSNSSLDKENPRTTVAAGHLSPLVNANDKSTYVYSEYDLLHLLRNNKSATYYGDKNDNLVASHLFKEGDSFSMSEYKSQFYKSGKLNSGLDLNWSFSVSEIGTDSKGTYAFIELTYFGK